LFCTLLNFSKEKHAPKCEFCEETTELYLRFQYALDAGTWTYKVLGVFLPVPPPDSWPNKEDGSEVKFYPFLVVMEYAKNKNNPEEKSGKVFWLPYWHTDEKHTRYGQWAPSLDHAHFKSLLEQAQGRFPDLLGPKS
jgi:hypothetical protein